MKAVKRRCELPGSQTWGWPYIYLLTSSCFVQRRKLWHGRLLSVSYETLIYNSNVARRSELLRKYLGFNALYGFQMTFVSSKVKGKKSVQRYDSLKVTFVIEIKVWFQDCRRKISISPHIHIHTHTQTHVHLCVYASTDSTTNIYMHTL